MKRFLMVILLAMLMGAEGAATAEFVQPCVSQPYGWQFQDATRQIVIDSVSANGVTYYAADVQLTDASLFQTYVSSTPETLSQQATQAQAVFAINADDFGVHSYGVIIRNGQLLRTHDTTRHMLVVDANGDFTVRTNRQNEAYEELGRQMVAAKVWQTFEFGPELVKNGQAVGFDTAFDLISQSPNRREPRTAIGQIGPLHYVVIVADGRQDGYSVGMTLPELQQVLLDYGTQTAMNLDGGGSAEMWFDGEIINSPSGGTERAISDMIFF